MRFHRLVGTVVAGSMLAMMVPVLSTTTGASAAPLPFTCIGPLVEGGGGSVTGVVPGFLLLSSGTLTTPPLAVRW
jgi:hypothetical protein